ncbi:purine nucleoside permease [Pseudonocardiaceae bacterium YIM PH 21723]|nr:purine nucleoside permease [Pseudonocardiaceae bacterium YIM PH 21723]
MITMLDDDASGDAGEARRWATGLTRSIPVPGLPAHAPEVRLDDRGLALVTTGMGEAGIAASLSALIHGGLFDLTSTYLLIAGICGIDPAQGTVGTVVWTDFAVHGGLAHHIDAREIPADWPSGYVALGADRPGVLPGIRLTVGNEVFQLNADLVRAAYEITADTELADDTEARELRAGFPAAPANAAPAVRIGSSLSDNTFWAGALLNARARQWVNMFTEGRGTYCTTQMEDNGALLVLRRAADAGLLNFDRIAILRSGSNFDQPAPGGRPQDDFAEYRGWAVGAENAYRVGSRFADHILTHWDDWS